MISGITSVEEDSDESSKIKRISNLSESCIFSNPFTFIKRGSFQLFALHIIYSPIFVFHGAFPNHDVDSTGSTLSGKQVRVLPCRNPNLCRFLTLFWSSLNCSTAHFNSIYSIKYKYIYSHPLFILLHIMMVVVRDFGSIFDQNFL